MTVMHDFFEAFHSEAPGLRPVPSELLTLLLEYWAKEKDHEINNQLLNDLVRKYAEAIRSLTELNQLKNRFLGIAAHDLRNPLTSIRGLSEILLTEAMGPIREDQKEYLSIIHSASNQMLALVSDLLDVSVIESGKLVLQPRRQLLRKLIEERLRIHKPLAGEKKITLHVTCAELPEQPFDAGKTAQVVDNLLSNAIKFSPPSSRIFLSVDREGPYAKVSVRDEGPGIPEQDQSRIFGEFEKGKGAASGPTKGVGLGLAIAKKIVEAHGGTLTVDSHVGSGSTFTFSLPLEE